MPTNLVKTERDERLWNKAELLAAKAGHAKDWKYVNGIYQKLKGSDDKPDTRLAALKERRRRKK